VIVKLNVLMVMLNYDLDGLNFLEVSISKFRITYLRWMSHLDAKNAPPQFDFEKGSK
jgi:hypothetical protein